MNVDILKFKDFEGTAEVDTTRGVCHGRLLFIDDLVTYVASSPRDLQREFEAAVEDYLATCQELGREPQRPFKGVFNVRLTPVLHRAAALRAVADGVALNELMVRAVDAYVHTRVEVNHNHKVQITVESRDPAVTLAAVASGAQQWSTAHVH